MIVTLEKCFSMPIIEELLVKIMASGRLARNVSTQILSQQLDQRRQRQQPRLQVVVRLPG